MWWLLLSCLSLWSATWAADPPRHVYVRPIPQSAPSYRNLQAPPSQPMVLMESRHPSSFDHFPPPPAANHRDYFGDTYQAPIPRRPLRDERPDSVLKEIPAPSLADYREKSVPSGGIQGRALFSGGDHQQAIVKAPASEIQFDKKDPPKSEKATKDDEYVIYYYYYYDNETNPNANLTNEFDDIPNLENYDKTLVPPPSNKVRPPPMRMPEVPQAMPREMPHNIDLVPIQPVQPVSNVFRYGNLDTPRIPITPLPVGLSPEPASTEPLPKPQEESNDVETDTEPATEPPTTLPPTTTTTEIPTTTTTERIRKRPPRIGGPKFGTTRRTTTTTTTTTSAPVSTTARSNRFRRPQNNGRFNRNRRPSTTSTTPEVSSAEQQQQPARRTTTTVSPRRALPSRPNLPPRTPGRSLESPVKNSPTFFRSRQRGRPPFKRPGAKDEVEESKAEEETTTVTEEMETTTTGMEDGEVEMETTVTTEPTTTSTTERPGPTNFLRRSRKRPNILLRGSSA